MELIIKPTGTCDFKCKFCSASELDIKHPTNGVQPQIKELIEKMKPSNIIVTGGEPLTLSPEYYFELYEICQCNIGLTSNMKNFYKDPYRWESMLKHPHINIGTSFNYGDTRLWDDDTVYTEDMFRRVNELYMDVTGSDHGLHFIAVISNENEDRIMDHVYLAKDIKGRVKINPAIGIGRQGYTYPRYKIIKSYIDIIDMGLEFYESTCYERGCGKCSMNTGLTCNTNIRCCYVDSSEKLHYGICDDMISDGHELPMDEFPVIQRPIYPSIHELYKPECLSCELHRMCNGCNLFRKHCKEDPKHCDEMLKLKDDIVRTGWAL